MLKEIYEQPRSVLDSMRGRLKAHDGEIKMGGIVDHEKKFEKAKRIIFVACGTSWHAGLVAITKTGISSSINAIGPCFISAAG